MSSRRWVGVGIGTLAVIGLAAWLFPRFVSWAMPKMMRCMARNADGKVNPMELCQRMMRRMIREAPAESVPRASEGTPVPTD